MTAVRGGSDERQELAGATVGTHGRSARRPHLAAERNGFQQSESKEPDARAKLGDGQPSLNVTGVE